MDLDKRIDELLSGPFGNYSTPEAKELMRQLAEEVREEKEGKVLVPVEPIISMGDDFCTIHNVPKSFLPAYRAMIRMIEAENCRADGYDETAPPDSALARLRTLLGEISVAKAAIDRKQAECDRLILELPPGAYGD